jgi:hypothetical protein
LRQKDLREFAKEKMGKNPSQLFTREDQEKFVVLVNQENAKRVERGLRELVIGPRTFPRTVEGFRFEKPSGEPSDPIFSVAEEKQAHEELPAFASPETGRGEPSTVSASHSLAGSSLPSPALADGSVPVAEGAEAPPVKNPTTLMGHLSRIGGDDHPTLNLLAGMAEKDVRNQLDNSMIPAEFKAADMKASDGATTRNKLRKRPEFVTSNRDTGQVRRAEMIKVAEGAVQNPRRLKNNRALLTVRKS